MIRRIAITLLVIPLAIVLGIMLVLACCIGLVVAVFRGGDRPWYTP